MPNRGSGGNRPNRQPSRNIPKGRGGGGRAGGRDRRNGNNNDTRCPQLPHQACYRSSLAPGTAVFVIQKQDQPTGQETAGIIARHLTNAEHHPRGIKVMLTSGLVGRVSRLADNNNNKDGVAAAVAAHDSTQEQQQQIPQPQQLLSAYWPTMNGNAMLETTAVTSITTPDDDHTTTSVMVDETALAQLVGDMNFEEQQARKALVMYDNHMERAVNYLLSLGES